MDFAWAILFFCWYEALALPLRAALADCPAPADVRRVLSRVAGPALLSLPIWWTSHAGGWALGRAAGIACWIALLALALRPWARRCDAGRVLAYRDVGATDASPGRQLALDGVTLALFLGFVAVRRWIPEMTTYPIDSSGAEKFMNMMIYWANWHATALPPEDYWLSGHPLTYYYWGHFHWAWLARLGGFPAELAINLCLARLVTLVFESGYLLARALGLSLGISVLAALAVAWAGNPSGVAEMWHLWQSGPPGYEWEAYNFWKPSRAIAPSVISEFPAFSALLGDFHAHHLALPWLLGWVAFSVGAGAWLGASLAAVRRCDFPRLLLGALVWWALGLTAALANLWNAPIMAFAVGLLLLCAALRAGRRSALATLGLSVGFAVLLLLSARMILGADASPLPAAESGSLWERIPIRWLPVELRSTPQQLFAMWGLPGLLLGLGALVRGWRARRWQALALPAAGWLLALLLWTAASSWSGASVAVWVVLACWIVSLAIGSDRWLSPSAAWLLVAACVILTGLELVFIDDAYAGEYERYNSYFKLSYPLWAPLWVGAAAAGRGLWQRAASGGRAGNLVWGLRLALIAVTAAAFVFPVCASAGRILAPRRLDDPPRRPTLNGVDFLAHRPPYSEEAPLLAWIRAHVPPGERVAEGVGKGAYGYVGRVASLAGRPVPLGWAHHERQWRGLPGHALVREREQQLDALYRSATPEELRRRAAELGVKWMIYGRVERERYGDPADVAGALAQLRRAGSLAAAFPSDAPSVFLFSLESDQ